MSAVLRTIALPIILPVTRAMMYVTTRLLEEDRKAYELRTKGAAETPPSDPPRPPRQPVPVSPSPVLVPA